MFYTEEVYCPSSRLCARSRWGKSTNFKFISPSTRCGSPTTRASISIAACDSILQHHLKYSLTIHCRKRHTSYHYNGLQTRPPHPDTNPPILTAPTTTQWLPQHPHPAMSSSNSTGLSASATNRLRKNLTTLAEDRVFPVVLETALFGASSARSRLRWL